MDDWLVVWQQAMREAEAAREDTRRKVLTDPVAHLVVKVFQRTLESAEGRSEAYRADAILDGTTAVLRLLEMAREGELV